MIEFSAKPDPQIVSTESGLAVQEVSLSRRPVDGKLFLLTAPFIEPPRPLLSKDAFGDIFLRSRPPLLQRRGLLASFCSSLELGSTPLQLWRESMKDKIVLVVLVFLLLFGINGNAQGTTATISGTVTDSSGAVVPGAKI